MRRTPLRESLRMLEREGLIRSEPNLRVRVAALTAADLEQLYTARSLTRGRPKLPLVAGAAGRQPDGGSSRSGAR